MDTGAIRDIFADAGVRGWVHAVPVDQQVHADDEMALDADDAVPMASLYKLPLLVSWCRAVDDGDLDPLQPVTLSPASRTPGPTGISTLRDPITLTRRDLVRLMMTLSDNAAADAVLAAIGLDRVAGTVAALGLSATTIRGGSAEDQRAVLDDTGATRLVDALRLLADVDHPVRTAAYDAAHSSATTARDLTRLLSAVWNDIAASPASCAFIRQVMAQQVWRHRLAAGFPHDDVTVAGKTGTLAALRHEAGVVSFPDEVPVAVAILTHAARPELALPRADAAIGAAARTAVTPLRRPRLVQSTTTTWTPTML